MKKTGALSTLLCLTGLLLFLGSCRNKEEKGPYINVTPNQLVLERNAGDLLEFGITATAGDNSLQSLRITQKPENGVTSVVKDTTLFGEAADFFYVYSVPSGVGRVLLTFTVYDTQGKKFSLLRDLHINAGSYLTETTGYELFSANTAGGNNAFNISGLNFFQLDANPDSSKIDLVEKISTPGETISRALTSFSGIRFVRNNAFNYAEATASSAQSNYIGSIPQQLITNLEVNDILITKYDTLQNKYAVIKITGIYDDAGTNLDRYTFNIKK